MARDRASFLRMYVLNPDHSVSRVNDTIEWGRQYESNRRFVAENFFGHEGIGTIRVSTIFLGIDHSFSYAIGGDDRPVLFETMIFGMPDGDGYQDRCCTYDEALVMHAKAVEYVKNAFTALREVSGA